MNEPATNPPEKIRVSEVYKVFGKDSVKALTLAEQGESREEILTKTGQTLALNNVSLSISAGEIFVVMGLSGSGKSTLLRCLNLLIRPTRGRVLVDGIEITRVNEREMRAIRREKFGMVFQGFGLFPHRSILENVEYGLEIQGVDPEQRQAKAREALEVVGLQGWENQKPHQLSGGMQQRVGLARALAIQPEILLMDEPFSALDPLIRAEMQDELVELQSRLAKTIVFITHDLQEAIKLGDRIAVMESGSVKQIGTPEEILMEPADAYVSEFVRGVDRSSVLTAGGIMAKPSAVTLVRDGPRVALQKMEEAKISSLFAVDRARKLKGLVTADDSLEAVRKGLQNLDGILRSDYDVVHPDTPFEDLIPIAAHARYPIPVVAEDGTLRGIVVRATVLRALAESREERDS